MTQTENHKWVRIHYPKTGQKLHDEYQHYRYTFDAVYHIDLTFYPDSNQYLMVFYENNHVILKKYFFTKNIDNAKEYATKRVRVWIDNMTKHYNAVKTLLYPPQETTIDTNITNIIKTLKSINFCGLCTTGDCKNCDKNITKHAAIDALYEVQKYHALGSPEELTEKLKELERWHTDVTNPHMKNEFANTSTSICHNCDHKDEYIEELEAEIEEYRKDNKT